MCSSDLGSQDRPAVREFDRDRPSLSRETSPRDRKLPSLSFSRRLDDQGTDQALVSKGRYRPTIKKWTASCDGRHQGKRSGAPVLSIKGLPPALKPNHAAFPRCRFRDNPSPEARAEYCHEEQHVQGIDQCIKETKSSNHTRHEKYL